MSTQNAVEIVERFWREVWQAQNPEAAEHLVAEDFIITSGGVDIRSRSEFKKWIAGFLSKINDFDFQVIETFQNAEGTRVASRWRLSGKNNGFIGGVACQSEFEMLGTAVWEVRNDGLLQHNWVERNALEVHRAVIG